MKKVTQKPLKTVVKKAQKAQVAARKNVAAAKKTVNREAKAVKKAVRKEVKTAKKTVNKNLKALEKNSAKAQKEQMQTCTILFLIGIVLFFVLLLLISKNVFCA